MTLKSWKAGWKPRKVAPVSFLKRSVNSPQFWERFAIVVSALALLVSVISTAATWKQVSLMSDQLVMSDRNRAIQNFSDNLVGLCTGMLDFYQRKRADKPGPDQAIYEASGTERHRAYAAELKALADKVIFSSFQMRIWLNRNERERMTSFEPLFMLHMEGFHRSISKGVKEPDGLGLLVDGSVCISLHTDYMNRLMGESIYSSDSLLQSAPAIGR